MQRFVAILLALCSPACRIRRGCAQTIKLGEINEYKQFPAFLDPYRKGMELAVDEINARRRRARAASSRSCRATTTARRATPCASPRSCSRAKRSTLLMGTFASNVGLAVADLAKRRQVLFIAAEPLTDKIVWESGNKYTFRLRASTYMQTAMLVPDAVKAGKKRWAIVYPNYEYGQAATATFKQQMQAQQGARPRVRRAGGAARQDRARRRRAGAGRRASPTRSSRRCSVPISRASSAKAQLRGLFKDRPVFNLLGGEPEYLDPLKDEAPIGWYVTGYPWYAIDTPEHKRFLDAYQAKFNDYPRLGSVVGYSAVKTAAAALAARGLDRHREARRRDAGPARRHAVRRGHVSRARPSVDDGRVRRPHRGARRQGRHGRLALRGRQGLPAARRRRAQAASGGLARAGMHAARPRMTTPSRSSVARR